jgi:hypothetical protein
MNEQQGERRSSLTRITDLEDQSLEFGEQDIRFQSSTTQVLADDRQEQHLSVSGSSDVH